MDQLVRLIFMDRRKAKQRRATRKRVAQAIENHWRIGVQWSRERWVDWLKDQGLISPRTNACDCRTVITTIDRLKNDTQYATIFGQPPELAAAALKKERDRLRYSALANAAERDELRFDLRAALDWIADGDDKEGMALIVKPLRAKYNLSNIKTHQ